ncbi:hypothetical protein E1281_32375 [Actinomadura sp. KC345]|uniref:PDC sensor domain-containing protein n=1 Tax=Actinomadura sp. KC345 TaxID=2530371 RepID=UPI00104B63F2|nr:PDC sensor domain-containing protein [Actinomadura sp. KC345]TDC44858.1 hypothetical protein E1281_32375 [Actinomadura sp. KC345]
MNSDKFHKEDVIDETDPSPAVQPKAGRWGDPYRARSTGLWTVHLRHPEAIRGGDGRLLATLTASDLHTLGDLMLQQDGLAREARR